MKEYVSMKNPEYKELVCPAKIGRITIAAAHTSDQQLAAAGKEVGKVAVQSSQPKERLMVVLV